MKKIRWGILGTGSIAHKFAADLKHVKGAELTAVGSRSLQKAQSFCVEFDVPVGFGSYRELAESDVADIIYIATPHNLHHENTILCLNSEKAVLCEKPFALNAKQASEMINMAKQKKLFLMDALWTKFLPHYQKMREMVNSGVVGDVKVVLANFGFRISEDQDSRLVSPEMGGGSLMDIGIYNVFTALDVLGKPDHIDVTTVMNNKGVDEQCALTFRYENGAVANLFSTFSADLSNEVEICGTLGRIKLLSSYFEPSSTLEHYCNGNKKIINVEKSVGFGYHYEAHHATICLQNMDIESSVVPHEYSLVLMQTLDKIRELSGIVFPGE